MPHAPVIPGIGDVSGDRDLRMSFKSLILRSVPSGTKRDGCTKMQHRCAL